MIFHLKIEVADEELAGLAKELEVEHAFKVLFKDGVEAELVVDHGFGAMGIPFRLVSMVEEHGSEWW